MASQVQSFLAQHGTAVPGIWAKTPDPTWCPCSSQGTGGSSSSRLDALPHNLVLVSTEKLGHCKLNVAEVTQSEIGQKQKLQTVLEAVQDLLRPHGWPLRWNVDCEWPLCGD